MLLTERLVRHANTLTASERALADGLMRGYPDSVLDSASAMAAAVGTSASTVVRLFAKLGYASLAELRREARGVVSTRLHPAGQRHPGRAPQPERVHRRRLAARPAQPGRHP